MNVDYRDWCITCPYRDKQICTMYAETVFTAIKLCKIKHLTAPHNKNEVDVI